MEQLIYKSPLTAPRTGVHRVSVPPAHAAKAQKKIVSEVSLSLQERLAKVKLANDLLNELLAPTREALQKGQEGRKQIAELRAANKAATPSMSRVSRNYANELTATIQKLAVLPPGLTVLTPPWDSSWEIPNDSMQFVNSITDANEGMGVVCHGSNNPASGFAASGYGVFISSPVQKVVSIRPYVPCDFGYSFWSLWYSSNSRGGYGVLIYDGAGNIVPGTLQQPEIWDRTAMNDDYTHIDGSDFLQNHLANGEIAFTMNAGETYQLWLWVWGHGDCSGIVFNDIFGNQYGSGCDFLCTASIPFIVIL